jgi:very-short-patch-repair endonuclease
MSDVVDTARDLRQHSTRSEEMLWSALRGRRFRDIKFRRQHPIGPFVLDFYCHSARLGIEIDGDIHDTDEARLRDLQREQALTSSGVRMLRLRAGDVERDLGEALHRIQVALEAAERARPRPAA